MKKKILSLILCIALVFSSMSIAFAAESSNITLGTQYTGTISSSATEKTYGVKLTKSGALNIAVMADMDALDMALIDEDGNTLWSTTAKRNSSLGVISNSADVQLAAGSYTLKLKQNGSYTGSFQFTAKLTTATESFAESAGGSNNSMDTAKTISVGKSYKGHLALNDNCDWYKFTLTKSGQIDLTLTWEGGYAYHGFYLEGDSDNKIWYNQNIMYNGLWGAQTVYNTLHLTAGTYYFHIRDDRKDQTAGGSYNFELAYTVANETCAEDNAGNDNNTILTADAMTLGKTYKGQIASNDKNDYYSFTVSKDMTMWLDYSSDRPQDIVFYDANGTEVKRGNSMTSYSNKLNFSKGSYYFRVAGAYNYNTGNYQFTLSEYKLDQPTLKSVSNLKSGVKVQWKQTNLATGYNIYRKKSGGSWAQIGSVSGGDVLTYTDTTALAGTKYSYSVQAYNTDLTSTYNKTGKTIKRLTQPVPTVANKDSAVKVTWKKVTGASGYYVYRKAGSATSWTMVKTIKATNVLYYNDKNVSNGTTYTYAVKAYSGDYTSAQSASKKTVRLTTPTIKSVKNVSGKKLKITYGKNSKATGYQIQYSTKKSFSSKKTLTNSGASKVTKTTGALTKGKTYYVRVRTYKKVNGVKYYSNWSTVKSKKVTK